MTHNAQAFIANAHQGDSLIPLSMLAHYRNFVTGGGDREMPARVKSPKTMPANFAISLSSREI